jgi:hypothetical protein
MIGPLAHRFDVEASDQFAGDAIQVIEDRRNETLLEAIFEQPELVEHRHRGRMAGSGTAVDFGSGQRLDQNDRDVTPSQRIGEHRAYRPCAGNDDPLYAHE